jgi:hypothetical protein
MYDGVRLHPDDDKVSFLPLTHPSVLPRDAGSLNPEVILVPPLLPSLCTTRMLRP